MSIGYKMVFIDLDGTTLTTDKRITPRTRRVIEGLEAAGIPVVISTGRAIYSIRQLFQEIRIQSPVITLNGSVIYEHVWGTVGKYHEIDRELLKELKDLILQRQEIDNLLFEGLSGYYTLQHDDEIVESFVQYRKRNPILLHEQEDFPEPITNLLVRPKEKKDEVHQWLQENTKDRFRFVKTSWHWLEGVNPKVNKGVSMQEVASSYGVSIQEVVAFGDEWNDLEMLAMAGLGVAMGNGCQEAKAIADLIAPTNDEEGVAKVLEEIFAFHLKEYKTS